MSQSGLGSASGDAAGGLLSPRTGIGTAVEAMLRKFPDRASEPGKSVGCLIKTPFAV